MVLMTPYQYYAVTSMSHLYMGSPANRVFTDRCSEYPIIILYGDYRISAINYSIDKWVNVKIKKIIQFIGNSYLKNWKFYSIFTY